MINEGTTYYYKGLCPGKVVVCYAPLKGNRVSVSRNLETRINSFFINDFELEEIMTKEERKEKEIDTIKEKYNKRLNNLNTHPVVKELKRYSEEDLRKIFNGIVKDLKKI